MRRTGAIGEKSREIRSMYSSNAFRMLWIVTFHWQDLEDEQM